MTSDLKRNVTKSKCVPRPAGRPWSVADDELLRRLAPKGASARLIGMQLDRTASAVRSGAAKLNLCLRKTIPKRQIRVKAKGK
jgi:hypothetical protein